MQKKLTLTIGEEVYDGFRRVVGPRTGCAANRLYREALSDRSLRDVPRQAIQGNGRPACNS